MKGLRAVDLGGLPYGPAYAQQVHHVEEVLASREAGHPEIGRVLLVEHDPVITVGRRPGSMKHLLGSPDALARAGVALAETDRGGDITYHGPGQLIAYPILDLNRLGLGLHAYMRLLESAVAAACASFGVRARRDEAATGVWVDTAEGPAKVCAMGVRVRKWVSLHGLALNVTTDLSRFELIVPCGLAGRRVTSLAALLGAACPPMTDVKQALVESLGAALAQAAAAADGRRAAATGVSAP